MSEIELELCPFCHEDKDGYTQAFGAFHLLWDRFDGWCLHAGKCKPKQIKFCPMCGNDLMSKEQIEKMAQDMYDVLPDHEHNYLDCRRAAEELFAKGWCKQSEGEWQKHLDGRHWCSECGHDATYTFEGTEICGVACPFCGAKMKGV